MKRIACLAFALLAFTPALAADLAQPARARQERAVAPPAQLSEAQREGYRAMFADLAAQNWASVAGRLDGMPPGPLHDYVRAQLYTLPGTPEVQLEPLLALLGRAADLPQAAALARLATRRGAASLPAIPTPQRLSYLGGQPRRERPRAVRREPLAATLDALISPLNDADQPQAAEALLVERGAELSLEARTEFLQRVAWVYYREGFDADARRVAEQARSQPGDWAIQAEWIAGLAAWRMQDCAAAGAHFQSVAGRTSDPEMAAAGHYWASRADIACSHPERVEGHLRAAAAREETFYGLLAESALGMRSLPAGEAEVLTERDWRMIGQRLNVRAALALIEIGRSDEAAALLRHQAQIGPAEEHHALVHLAARLNLPSLQTWLAHNGPRGLRLNRHARYPAPDWRPAGGWQVDQALAYAHALQESNFRPEAVSPAGARGLMQVRPGTAGDLVRWGRARGDLGRLGDPVNNLEFGQAYLRYLAEQPGIDGLLPRVIAAYNAGPAPVAVWAAEGRYGGDPLLYIESINYWETRGYVPIVLRNYWMYELAPADASVSRRALTQGLWPRFPGLPGPTAVRLDATGRVLGGSD
jgi:soluble lytic murein transglycosylase